MKRVLVVLLLLGCFSSISSASPVLDDSVVNIVDQFYDLKFDQAMASAKELDRTYPSSPAGAFYRSVDCFQRYLLEDPPQPDTFKAFRDANKEALRLAVALEKSDPAASHYYRGAALGFLARAYVAQRKYAQAIPKAREGADELEEALKIDPARVDAKLGLGMYYYFLARIPLMAKPVAYLLVGMHGDREKGLVMLEDVAAHGHAARMEAKSILGAIYASESERRWEEAFFLFKELMTKYPHNPRYRLSLAYVYERQGLWQRALEVLDSEGRWVQGLDPLVRSRALAFARYRSAESFLFSGRYHEAERMLSHLDELSPRFMQEWIHLRAGNLEDVKGNHAKARSFYGMVQKPKPRKLAEKFEETPFPSGPQDIMPNRWPLPSVPE